MANQVPSEHLWRKVRFLSIAIDNNSEDYQLYLKRSDVYFQLRLYRLSALDASFAISLNKCRPEAVLRKSDALIALDRFKDAEAVWNEFKENCPNDSRIEEQMNKLRFLAVKNIGFEDRHCELVAKNTCTVQDAIEKALLFENEEAFEDATQSFSINNSKSAMSSSTWTSRENQRNSNDELSSSFPKNHFSSQASSLSKSIEPVRTNELIDFSPILNSVFNSPTKEHKSSPRKPNTVKRSPPLPMDLEETENVVGPTINPQNIIEELINCPSFHQKLAETINKVYAIELPPKLTVDNPSKEAKSNHENSTIELKEQKKQEEEEKEEKDQAKSNLSFKELDEFLESNEVPLTEDTVKNIMDGIENDPVYEEFISMCQKKFYPDLEESQSECTSPIHTPNTDFNSSEAKKSSEIVSDICLATNETTKESSSSSSCSSSCSSSPSSEPEMDCYEIEESKSNLTSTVRTGKCTSAPILIEINTSQPKTTDTARSARSPIKLIKNQTQKRSRKTKRQLPKKGQFDHVKPYPDFVKNLMNFMD